MSDEFLYVVLHKANPSGPPGDIEMSFADDLVAANQAELTRGREILDRTSVFLGADPSPVVIAGLGERFDFLRCYTHGFDDALAQALLVDDNPARVEARLALKCVPSRDLGRFAGNARRGLTTFWNSNLAASTIDWFAPYANRNETNEPHF